MHLMIDIETLGRAHDAAILEIGCCLFTLDEIREKFSWRIQVTDALKYGTTTPDTIKWWMEQSDEARKHVFGGSESDSLQDALNSLKDVIDYWKPSNFWAHASFDFPILANAYNVMDIENPIYFRKCRDIRTLDMLAHAEKIENWPIREGTFHSAIDDAVHQAKCVQLMLKSIGWSE